MSETKLRGRIDEGLVHPFCGDFKPSPLFSTFGLKDIDVSVGQLAGDHDGYEEFRFVEGVVTYEMTFYNGRCFLRQMKVPCENGWSYVCCQTSVNLVEAYRTQVFLENEELGLTSHADREVVEIIKKLVGDFPYRFTPETS